MARAKREMDEASGRHDSFLDAKIEKQENGNSNPTHKRKTSLRKSRKKREKKRDLDSCVTGHCDTVKDEEDEDESTSDFLTIISSTSDTENVPKAKFKELKVGKRTGTNSPNFAKVVKTLNAAPFVFQKRLSRIDWRKLHTVDVDKIVREADLDTLESVLDTITFGDIQGEDTRNFSEANFIKVFRLAQLMVEYLLHAQELLATHKETLLETGAAMQRRIEKHCEKQVRLRDDLSVLRHEFKQAKKTLRTYEIMLHVQNKCQDRQQKLHQSQQEQQLQLQLKQQQSVGAQTVRCCPLCDKMFESAYYLDLHITRRHPKSNEIPEDKILAAVSKAEEVTAARGLWWWVRCELKQQQPYKLKSNWCSRCLRPSFREAKQQRSFSFQWCFWVQISSLEASVRESSAKLQEFQGQLQAQILRKDLTSPEKKRKDNKMQERLKEMDEKLHNLQCEMKDLREENCGLVKELASAYSKGMIAEDRVMSSSVSPDRKDGQARHRKWKMRRSSSAEKTVNEQRKCNYDRLSSPESPESEGRQTIKKQVTGYQSSSPERKRKHRWQYEHSVPAHSPDKIHSHGSVSNKHRDLSPGRQRVHKRQETHSLPIQEGDGQPKGNAQHPLSGTETLKLPSGKNSPRSPSGRHTPRSEVIHDLESGVHTPQLEARFKDVGEKAFALAKAEIEQDLVHAEENRLLKEDAGKVATRVANFETKFGSKKIRCNDAKTHEKLEVEKFVPKDNQSFKRNKEKIDVEEKNFPEEAIEDEVGVLTQGYDSWIEVRRKAEIADAVSMDVGEDHPSIPPSEKEKWLEEHPYKPIPQRPHVVSRYPHPPNIFSSTRKELAQCLDEQLGGEMRKFGFGSDTAGISDPVYDAAKVALEKQHKTRLSNLHLSQKKSLEHERGAILWHTQRAVRERDIQIIESRFEEESDISSQQSSSADSHLSLEDVETNRSSTLLQDQRRSELSARSPVVKSPKSLASPTIRSPTSPMSPHLKVHEQVKRQTGHIADMLENLENMSSLKHNPGRLDPYNTLHHQMPPENQLNRLKHQGQSPPQSPHETHHGKEPNNGKHTPTYLFPTLAKFKKVEESSRLKDDENQEAFGLGQWDSDEDVPSTTTMLSGIKETHKNGLIRSPKCSKEEHVVDSDEGSEETKLFQELDAEIDEIIRL